MPDSLPQSIAPPVRNDRVNQPTDTEPNWLDQLAEQLDDTIELIERELNDDRSKSNPGIQIKPFDGLGVTEFPIEEYDWG